MRKKSIRYLAFTLFALFSLMSVRGQTNVMTNGATLMTDTNAVANMTSSVTSSAPPKNQAQPGFDSSDSSGSSKDLVPVVAIVCTFTGLAVIFGMMFYAMHRQNKMKHETIRMMIEKGVPITPEILGTIRCSGGQKQLFGPFDPQKRPRNDFRQSLILLAVGAGITVIVGKVGWIIVFIGGAFLISSLIEKKHDSNDQPPK